MTPNREISHISYVIFAKHEQIFLLFAKKSIINKEMLTLTEIQVDLLHKK